MSVSIFGRLELTAALLERQALLRDAAVRGTGTVEPPARPLDALDEAAAGGVVDLHADTPLHHLALEGEGSPNLAMKAWMGVLRALGGPFPQLRNYTRQVTRESLDQEGKGLQVFSSVTRGLPPFFEGSHRLYANVFAGWPEGADQTALNAFVSQAGWVYREVQANADRLALAPDAAAARAALEDGKVGVQLGIEGAFPFEPAQADADALMRFFEHPGNGLPKDFPRPTAEELADTEGLLRYARRLGVQYIGLNHLASSDFAGSGMWGNADRGAGISDAGRELVRQMDGAGILLDLAHASPWGQRDAVTLFRRGEYRLPLVVSHGVVPLPGEEETWRTTSREALDAVRDSGGIFGVIGARQHLAHGGSRNPLDVINDMADQIDIVRGRIGIDHVGLGLDADGFVGLGYATAAEVADALRGVLRGRGYSEDELSKIFGGNYLHVLQRRDERMAARSEAKLAANG